MCLALLLFAKEEPKLSVAYSQMFSLGTGTTRKDTEVMRMKTQDASLWDALLRCGVQTMLDHQL